MEKSKKRRLPVLTVLVLAAVSGPAAATDYAPYDPGSRAPARGGAFVARADDVTALFVNPAGLAFLKGIRFKTNIYYGKPALSAVRPATGQAYASNPRLFRGTLAASGQVWKGVTAGVGFYTPYQSTTIWPWIWPGDRDSSKASMDVTIIRPAVAVELPGGLALGLGLDIVRAKAFWRHILPFNLEKYPLPKDALIRSTHETSGSGAGFTAGLLWKAHPKLQLGARYQHGVAVDLDGKNTFLIGWENDFAILPDPVEKQRRLYDLLTAFYSAQTVASDWGLPREVSCGFEFRPLPVLSVELDLEWTDWSALGDWTFRSLNPEDALSPAWTLELQEFYGIKPDYGVQSAGIVLEDAWRVKAGLEVAPAAGFALRAGYARHPSPVAETSLHPAFPCLDRDVVSLGFGYEGDFFSMGTEDKLGQISFDVFAQYGFARKGTASLAGAEIVYQEKPWTVGVGVGAIF